MFDQRQCGHQAVFCGQLEESLLDLFTCFAADRGIRGPRAGQIFREFDLASRRPQMIESGVGRDSPCPSAKIAGRVESVARPVNTPECFHGEILSNSAVAYDANNPEVDFLLVLPKQRLEGLQVARREPFQQFHPPLSISTYCKLQCEVTADLEEA